MALFVFTSIFRDTLPTEKKGIPKTVWGGREGMGMGKLVTLASKKAPWNDQEKAIGRGRLEATTLSTSVFPFLSHLDLPYTQPGAC